MPALCGPFPIGGSASERVLAAQARDAVGAGEVHAHASAGSTPLRPAQRHIPITIDINGAIDCWRARCRVLSKLEHAG